MRRCLELQRAGQRNDTLLVLLPPSLSSIDAFYDQGFVEALRMRNLPVDLLLADVGAQHVMDKTVVSVLHQEVIQPALARGYRAIWLAGISMGGFNALHYAASHMGLLAGILLLAPYPGTGDVLAELRCAGGVAPWCQTKPSLRDERNWWHWLGLESLQGRWTTPVYMSTGSHDRFLVGQRLLADLLPAERVRVLEGKHEWATWKALWLDWLTHGPLA